MTNPTTITLDDAIRTMAGATTSGASTEPLLEAMQWSLDNWDTAAPRFSEMLSRYADGIERSPDIETALLYIVHMLGEKSETAAFVPLCKLLRDKAATETVIGDSVVLALSKIMISTFDGNIATLRGVIEDADAHEYARHDALLVMAWLTRTGRIPREETRAYMRHLLATMQPDDESAAWLGWTDVVWLLGFPEFAPDVQRLFEEGFVARVFRGYEHFAEDLQHTLDDPESMAGFDGYELYPFQSSIEEVTRWFRSTVSQPADGIAAALARSAEPGGREPRVAHAAGGRGAARHDAGPYHNPVRQVGRNDPCPCGSGKKFKKCCLGKAELVTPARAA